LAEKPSAIARAQALAMRAFDHALTAQQIDAIARQIEVQRALGEQLAPAKKPLANALEPLTAIVLRVGPV
jgi:hypothetical protein